MTNIMPQVDPNGYYNVNETAAALGVDRHTVRRYELQGCIIFRVRKAGKRKYASGAQIVKCWQRMY